MGLPLHAAQLPTAAIPSASSTLAEGEATATSRETGRWIAELGHDQFLVRQLATQRLATNGAASVPALVAAAEYGDPEIRQRAGYVLAIVRKQQQRAQVARLRQGEPIAEGDLPGWPLFVSVVGDTPASRELFAQLISREWDLVSRVEQQPLLANELVRNRVSRLNRNRSRSAADRTASVAAILLIQCREDIQLRFNALEHLPRMLRESLPSVPKDAANPIRTLLVQSFLHAQDPPTAHSFLDLAQRYDLPEVLPLAKRVLLPSADDHTEMWDDVILLRNAMSAVARFGSVEQVEWLLPHMDDARPCVPQRAPAQIRDLALATALHLSNEDPIPYGLPKFPESLGIYASQRIEFADEPAREAAFALWHKTWNTRLANRDERPAP